MSWKRRNWVSTKRSEVGRDRRSRSSGGVKMKLGLMPLKPGVPVPVAGSKVPKLVNAAIVPDP